MIPLKTFFSNTLFWKINKFLAFLEHKFIKILQNAVVFSLISQFSRFNKILMCHILSVFKVRFFFNTYL